MNAPAENTPYRGSHAALRQFGAAAACFGGALMITPATASSAPPATPFDAHNVFAWERQADLPDPVGWKGMYAGVSEGRVLLAGGSNFPVSPREGGRKVLSRQILARPIDATADGKWTVADETLPGGQAEGAAVSIDAGVLLVGGVGENGPVANVYFLRWDAGLGAVKIRSLPPLPVPCASPAAVRCGRQILVAGGEKDGRGLDHFWSLDIVAALAGAPTAVWKTLPSWPGPPRFGAVLAVLEVNGRERVFLLGGKVKTTGATLADYLNDVYCYDPIAGQWTALSPMPHPAVQAGSIKSGASRLAILGGSDGHDLDRIVELGEQYRLPDRIMIYDANSDHWRSGGRMPLGVAAPAIVELGHDWLVAGGEYSPGLRTPEVHRAKVISTAVTKL